MATPQAGIFHEGTSAHWFQHFAIRHDAPLDQVRAALRTVVKTAAGPHTAVEIVLGFGRALLERLDPGQVPPGLVDFPEIVGNAGHRAVATQEDVFVWAQSDRQDRNFEVALAARRALGALGSLARETPNAFVYLDSRDLTGFIDGTENPEASEARTLAVVPDGDVGEGGSFVLTQRWIHDLDQFHALPIAEQESVIGRTKADSIELDGKPPTAHISRVVIEEDGEELEIYRRSVPYGNATEAGLYFLAFTDDLTKIDRMLRNMFGASADGMHDRLVDFSTPVSGAFYFAPPVEALARMLG